MTKTIPNTFDALFEKHRGPIPLSYLRALAWNESRMDPKNRTGTARGLLQVVDSVRRDFNKGRGQSVAPDQLFEAETNVVVATDLLRTIVRVLQAEGLKADWTSPEWAKLVTASWNSGWSRKMGVPKVLRHLKSQGLPLSHDNVFKHSAAASATRHLRNPKKQRWQRKVVRDFLEDVARRSVVVTTRRSAPSTASQRGKAPNQTPRSSTVPVPPIEASAPERSSTTWIAILGGLWLLSRK